MTFRLFGGRSTLPPRDRSGTPLFRNAFAYERAVEPFHRLSSNVDQTFLAPEVEMRSMLRIAVTFS
jgi:hypothetical protein